jgi:hypothetical protein
MTRSGVIVLLLVILGAGAYVFYHLAPTPQRNRLIGTWRLVADRAESRGFVFRADGTGTLTYWNHTQASESHPLEMEWTMSTEERRIFIKILQRMPRRGDDKIEGSYQWVREGIMFNHAGGPIPPGTFLYEKVE